MANINQNEVVTAPEVENEVVAVDPAIAELQNDVKELTEVVNAINEKLNIGNEEVNVVEEKEENEIAPFSEQALDNAVSYGLPFSLFGFSIVFSVLAIIMAIVFVFGKIFGVAQPKQNPVQTKKPEPKKQQTSMIEETVAVAPATPASDDKGIVAAIMAAISSFRTANGENGGFRVVSFKKRK